MPKRRKTTRRSNGPLWLIGAGVLILVGLLVYMAVSGRSQNNVAGADIPYPEIERVSLIDAGKAHTDQSAIFLDVRDADTYTASHISGAVNIQLGELERRSGELDKNRWIITYCT